MRLVTAVLTALLLPACSPEYNWREIHATDQGYRVMLPAKPASMTRTIQLDDSRVSMTMQGARVGVKASFTVAVAQLDEDSDAARASALDAMRKGMLRNIAGSERSVKQARVSVIDAAGAAHSTIPATRIEAVGAAQNEQVTMLAGFAARGARAYQWVVLGTSVDGEQAATFLDSFKLVAEKP